MLRRNPISGWKPVARVRIIVIQQPNDGAVKMNKADEKSKVRDIKIAQNESEMQATGDVRVSIWAVVVAVIIGLAVFGWFLSR